MSEQAQAAKPKQPFNNLTPKQQKAVWIALPFALFGAWSIYSSNSGTTSSPPDSAVAAIPISYCEQEIKSCKRINDLQYDCLFTNSSSVAVNPSDFRIARYDSSGVAIGDGPVDGSMVYPGQTAHIQFLSSKFDNVASIKICSVDPNSPLGQKLPFKQVN